MKHNGRDSKLYIWGRMVFRFRRAIAAVWLILFLALLPLAFKLPALLQHNGFTSESSPSQIAITKLEEGLDLSSAILDIVIVSNNGDNLTTGTAQRRLMDELAPFASSSYVRSMYWNLATHDAGENHIVSAKVYLDMEASEALAQYETIRSAIPDIPGADVYVTGSTAVFADMNEAIKSDIIRAELIGIPAALIILLLVFRNVTAALLPLIVGVTSVIVTMGALYFPALVDGTISNFLPNVVTMLGLAVGIDYALLVVSRFREEIDRGADPAHAVGIVCATAGKAVIFSGTAVLIGFVAMGFIDLPIFRSFSIGGITVVLVSVLAANTLLLGLLGMLGRRIHALPVLPARKRGAGASSGLWNTIAGFVMARPVSVSIAVILVLLGAMLPLKNLSLTIPDAEVLPPAYESRYGQELLMQAYNSRELGPIMIAVELPAPYDDPSSIELLKTYMDEVRQLPDARRVESYLSIGRGSMDEVMRLLAQADIREQLEQYRVVRGNMAIVAVVPEHGELHPSTTELVEALRGIEMDGLSTYVTGNPAYKYDIIQTISRDSLAVLVFVFLATYIILCVAFRSILLPLKASLMNVLSLGAGLGVVAWVFQEGVGAEWLGVTYTGSLFALLPILIFCVVFGISMDYEVMLLSRIMESYERTGDNDRSTIEGLENTGGLITGAALILSVVVGAFLFTDNEVMKAIGLGLTAAVLLDATLIRILLVPAFMKLLGRANWWSPGWMFASRKRAKSSLGPSMPDQDSRDLDRKT
ncbi:MMPL family transporter [Paenibacillus campinasensis]|uniref:MMPL family transporter n=1 Tax=Paenibacillus campinasensis TaxID=66347 RepID=A0A268EJI1_9BACL|nr:MMPL family transporter [Paenibacillus campinasensis]MUG68678.1 MMPL family transporter [Paenibacillus campinasensis]PAD73272.1 hypothetical protein CHH67_20510 [Paenibacillus campinasensis]